MFNKINEFIKNHQYSRPAIFALILIAFYVVYHQKVTPKNPLKAPIPINSDVAKKTDLPIYLKAIGNVSADFSANIQSQVSGQIMKVHFTEGQKVKKGDILVEIDPSFYKAQVEQYQGQLARDKALLENALVDLHRYELLWKENSTSNQTLITQQSLVEQYKGTIRMDQGQLDNALVNLGYCTITAPFDGVVGILAVTEGNIVSSNTNIALLNSIDPISVLFTLPEVDIPEVREEFIKNGKLDVEVFDQFGKTLISKGELFAIDNQVNSSTGTVQLKAKFNNSDEKLFPNQFVNVKLKLREIKDALVVPSSAIQYGPNGTYVYVVDKKIAKIREVKVGAVEGNYAFVASGLSEQEVVATSGTDMLTEDAKVIISKRD